MIDLQLRQEFRDKRLKGTTVDFTNQSKTGALDIPATEFLKITYPSVDLLKAIEATGPEQSRPVVLLGDRGQGKSHLLAALYHLCTNPDAGGQWLAEWSDRLNTPLIGSLKLRSGCCVIAESLHLHRHKHLWDILFKHHPKGKRLLGKWEGLGETNEKSAVASLLDSVANQQHKDLRERAIRNLEAVRDAPAGASTWMPVKWTPSWQHCDAAFYATDRSSSCSRT